VGGHPRDAPDGEVVRRVELGEIVGGDGGVHAVCAQGAGLSEDPRRGPPGARERAGGDQEDAERIQEIWVVMARTRSWKS
jgi:hypothetical protein